MATPPFDIAETLPQSSNLLSQFPSQSQTFRDVVESWLLTISTNMGVLKTAAMDVATAANIRANTADKVLDTDGVWSSVDYVSVTDAATIAFDMSTFINCSIGIGGNRTFGNPTNVKMGQSGLIRIVNTSGADRTISLSSDWRTVETFPVTVANNTSAYFFYFVIQATSSNRILVSVINNPT